MPEPSNETLVDWLSSTAVTLDAEGIKAYQAAIGYVLAKASTAELLDVVALAHRVGGPSPTAWLTELARSKQPAIPLVRNDELMAQLASAIVIRALSTSSPQSVLAGLAVHSAQFLGLTPARPEVTTFADAAIVRAGDAVRARPIALDPIAPQISGWVEEGSAAAAEEASAESQPEWKLPILRAAEALDELAANVRRGFELLDEEYDLLWWSHSERSAIADVPWDNVTPPERRTVLVAEELGQKVKRIPATAMVDGLAAVALGDAATKSLSLVSIVATIRDLDLAVAGHEHALLPVSTSVRQAAIYEDDTWIKVLKQVHKINAKSTHGAVDIARQLIRERQIADLL